MTDEESALYALAIRLIPSRRGHGAEPQLLAGQLPPDLPFETPLPPGSRLIGTLADGPFRTILLDTDLTPAQALGFYTERLTATGWSTLDTGRTHGGFEFANHSHGAFCYSPRGPKLNLNSLVKPAEPTQVRIDIDLTPDVPCEEPGGPRSHPGPIPPLPELAPPPGAILQRGGGEASPFGTSDYAYLNTALDLADVAVHYADQLRQAGCTQRDRGAGNDLAWSIWYLDDPDYGLSQVLFLALRQAADHHRYFLYERVEWILEDFHVAD